MTKNIETKIKVLVVDDDKDICFIIKTNLKNRGHLVEQAYRGEEALVKIEEFEPHVILLDIKMPGVTGDRLVTMITNMYPNIKVIMVAGEMSDEDKKILINYGAFDCMHKPVASEDLNNKILEAVK